MKKQKPFHLLIDEEKKMFRELMPLFLSLNFKQLD